MNTLTAVIAADEKRKRGNGKTLTMTALGYEDFKTGRKIVANYHLFFGVKQYSLKEIKELKIDHKDVQIYYMTFSEISLLPHFLRDATVLLDEVHMGADSRRSLLDSNMQLSTLISQMRKRGLVIYFSTQQFKKADRRLRDETDVVMAVENLNPRNPKYFKVDTRDRYSGQILNTFYIDGMKIYDKYDTDEVISFEGETETY